MEAAPRLQMLCFEQKLSPKASDFSNPLKKFIATFYNEDPSIYSKAIHDLEQLRMAACKTSKDTQCILTLQRYYSQLRLQQNRFPMTDDGAACVAFMWSDLYSGVMFNIADVKYELSSILYNIGALHSQLGAMEDRTTAEGMRSACTEFQRAAWAFAHNRDTYPQPKGCDLSHDLLTFYSLVMLAQSQECILEKSMLDNRKSGTSAKIASQIVDFYAKSINNLSSDVKSNVGSKIFQRWKRICQMKATYYGALTAFHMGIMAEEDNQYGLRVAWYKLAMERFEESLKAAEDIGIEETLAFTRDVIGGKLNVAIRENDFVYHDKVPSCESLPEVKGANLVKGIPFDANDPEICGPDLFSTLIPMAAHEASSVYSEKKAQILRRISKFVEDKDAELAAYESSLNITKEDLSAILKKPALPPDVIEVCAQFSTNQLSTSKLNEQLAKIDSMSEEVRKFLGEAEELVAMSNPSSVTSNVVADLRAELNKSKELRSHSAFNNDILREALRAHEDQLALFQHTPDILEQKLPHMIAVTREDEKIILEFIKLLDKLEEMKLQRQRLFTELRDSMINDDITKLIVANAHEDLNEVLARALSKHKHAIDVLEKNFSAQDNILKAVSHANANTADIRLNLEQARKPWATAIEGMRAAYKAFEEVEKKAKSGVDFYGKFVEDARRLATRLRSVIQVEKEQEERLRPRQANSARPSPVKNTFSSTNIPSNIVPQYSQPPKLKDYLALMNNAKKNDYVPQAMPGSPGISQTSLQSSVAISPMGLATSVTGNTQSPQMSFYSIANQGVSQSLLETRTSTAVLPPGAQIVTASSNEQDSSLHAGQENATFPRSVGLKGTSQTPPLTYSGSRTNHICNPYVSNNLGGYGYPVHQAYAPYAHLYSSMDSATNVKSISTVTKSASTSTQAASVPTTASNHVHVTSIPTQNKHGTSSQYNGTMDGSSGFEKVTDCVPISDSSSFGTSWHTNRPASVGQQRCYTDPSLSSSSANAAKNSYNWYGYNLPSASPTASASTVVSSGRPIINMTSNGHLYDSRQYAQYYQMYANQYQAFAVSSQPSAMPNSCTQQPITVNPSLQLSAMTIIPPIASSESSVVSMPAAHIQELVSLPSSGVSSFVPENIRTGNVGVGDSIHSTPSIQPTSHPLLNPSSITSQGPTSYANANFLSTLCTTTTDSLNIQAKTINNVQPAFILPPKQETPVEHMNVIINSAARTSEQLNSLLDESPALQMPSEGQTPQNILQPIVLSAILGDDELSDPKSQIESTESASNAPVLAKEETSSFHGEQPQPTFLDSRLENAFEDPCSLRDFTKAYDVLDDYIRNFHLENRWKEFLDLQEAEARTLKISVGRICSMKNRFPDIMPYDYNRVVLNTTKDDYINASHIKWSVSGEPNYILTQAPTSSTLEDFWAMAWEQDSETILCLSSFQELSSQLFFPSEKGTIHRHGQYQVSVQSHTQKEGGLFSERLLSVLGPQGLAKNMILLHLHEWTRDTTKLSAFGNQVLYYNNSQKRKSSPIVIQCLGGCGRSGVITFCLKWLSHLRVQQLYPVMSILKELIRGRKLVILEKDQLRTCVEFAHHTARSILIEKGYIEEIVNNTTEIEEIYNKEKNGEPLTVEERLLQDLMAGFQVKTKITKESFDKPRGLETTSGDPSDPLSQLDPLWSLKK